MNLVQNKYENIALFFQVFYEVVNIGEIQGEKERFGVEGVEAVVFLERRELTCNVSHIYTPVYPTYLWC